MPTQSEKNLVHVVASVNLDAATGQILYVNPSHVPSGGVEAAAGMGGDEVTLVARDADGRELLRLHPEVRLDSCHDADDPLLGLIQQDVGVVPGMRSIDLQIGDKVVDTFVAGRPVAAAVPEFGLGPESAEAEHRRTFGAGPIPKERGVSYVIQAKPDNASTWSTLAVGQDRPNVTIDKNQFPGATELEVKVIRSTGFSEDIIETQTIPLVK